MRAIRGVLFRGNNDKRLDMAERERDALLKEREREREREKKSYIVRNYMALKPWEKSIMGERI